MIICENCTLYEIICYIVRFLIFRIILCINDSKEDLFNVLDLSINIIYIYKKKVLKRDMKTRMSRSLFH